MSGAPPVPPMLVEAVRLGKCIAFVGAGLSAGCGAPSWLDLMRDLIDLAISEGKLSHSEKGVVVDVLGSRGPEILADALRIAVGERQFLDLVESRLKGLSPGPVHSAVVGPPCLFRAVFTTNYDCLIEKAYRNVYPRKDLRVVTPEEINVALHASQRDEFYLMKLHGCITRGKLVLTRPEFIDLQRNQAYADFLMGQFLNHTFLFMGHSLSDDDTRRLLEHLASDFPMHGAAHFCLLRKGEIHPLVRERLADLYKLQFLEYEQHADILPFLRKLARLAGTSPPSRLSDVLTELIPALGLILDGTTEVDGLTLLVARRIEGSDAATFALAAVPHDATEDAVAQARAAASRSNRGSALVVRMPPDEPQ